MPASELGYVPWTKKVCTNEKAYNEGISNCDEAAKLACNDYEFVKKRYRFFHAGHQFSTGGDGISGTAP